MLKIYHNPRCRRSREGLNYLKSKTTDFEIIDYLKDGLTSELLDEILLKSNLKPEQLVRKQEEAYKKELKGRSFTTEEWKRIFIETPKLLKRPIVVGKHKAILAQPPENLDKLI